MKDKTMEEVGDLTSGGRDGFREAQKVFSKYLDFFRGPELLAERIAGIKDYSVEKNITMLAFLFKQSSATALAIGSAEKLQDNIDLVMQASLVLIDSMAHAGYIKEEFLPKELKIENYVKKNPKTIKIPVSKEQVDKVRKDHEENKKSNGKK